VWFCGRKDECVLPEIKVNIIFIIGIGVAMISVGGKGSQKHGLHINGQEVTLIQEHSTLVVVNILHDNRVDELGQVFVTGTSLCHKSFGRLMLAHRLTQGSSKRGFAATPWCDEHRVGEDTGLFPVRVKVVEFASRPFLPDEHIEYI
tara:strand:+ start:401 stop:841 length:441 start_codon:yes stop_codon:yes gene_type:complete